MTTSVPAAIVLGAVIIALAIAFSSHWSVQTISGRPGVIRLNRWTGEVVWCGFTANATPSYFDCQPDDWVSVPPKQ
jgi:hypothetical protein